MRERKGIWLWKRIWRNDDDDDDESNGWDGEWMNEWMKKIWVKLFCVIKWKKMETRRRRIRRRKLMCDRQ